MAAINAIYEMPWWERALYRYLLVPRFHSALADQAARFDWMDRGPTGAPAGSTRSIRSSSSISTCRTTRRSATPTSCRCGTSRPRSAIPTGIIPCTGINSTPIPGNRARGRYRRRHGLSGLHGGAPDARCGHRFHRASKSHLPRRLPPRAASRTPITSMGRRWRKEGSSSRPCAVCHEPGGARFRTVIPAVEIGTDRHRIDMWTEAAKERYMNYRSGGYDWGFREFHKTNGYLANELPGCGCGVPICTTALSRRCATCSPRRLVGRPGSTAATI